MLINSSVELNDVMTAVFLSRGLDVEIQEHAHRVTHIALSLSPLQTKRDVMSIVVTNELGCYSNSATGRGVLISCFLIQVRFICGRVCH